MSRLLFLLCVLLAGCVASKHKQESTAIVTSPTKSISQSTFPDEKDWEHYFKLIKKYTDLAGIYELRKTTLPVSDFEVRVWYSGSFEPMECVIIRKKDDAWEAVHLKGNKESKPTQVTKTKLSQPSVGWEVFWERLGQQDILQLPGSVGMPLNDGSGYLVEVRAKGIYKPSVFLNPQFFAQKGAKEILEISNILAREFHLPHFDRTASIEKEIRH